MYNSSIIAYAAFLISPPWCEIKVSAYFMQSCQLTACTFYDSSAFRIKTNFPKMCLTEFNAYFLTLILDIIL